MTAPVDVMEKLQREAEAEEAEAEAALAMDVGNEPAEGLDQAPMAPSAELLKPPLALLFKKGAPNWRVSPAESNELADALGAVIDKWVPGGILVLADRWKEEVALVMCVISLYSTRAGVPLKIPPVENTPATDVHPSQV